MSSNDSVIAYLHRYAKPVSLRDVDHNYTIITPHAAALTDINSSIDLMYSKYLLFIKNRKIKSDVNLKKGY